MKILFKYEVKSDDRVDDKSLLETILTHRKINNFSEFINPRSPLTTSLIDFDKNYKTSFTKVIKILKEIKASNQMIVVYTDYDADGITGGAILWETLYILGFKVMPYVPDRKNEGYGFSITGIDNCIKKYNPSLIISVDHGITKNIEITYAKKLGIKTIITDHHLQGKSVPKADAVFHIPKLSGSGVSYFFAKEIFNYFKQKKLIDNSIINKLNDYFSFDYISLAAIGSIADLVPLTNTCRSIVKYGLNQFHQIKRIGVKELLIQSGIDKKPITPYEVGFIIAPRINAIGRLENAIDALRLLCTNNHDKAKELASKIGLKNIERQQLVEKSVEEAKLKLQNLKSRIPKIIILISDNWHEGIIGLIASKLADEFYRPTLIITKTNHHYKGSARSIPGFDITKFLQKIKKYLIDVGGHPQAAGFTLSKDQLKEFCLQVKKISEKIIDNKILEKIILADIKIPLSKISIQLVKSLELLEPYGIGNPQPVFYSQGIISDAKLVSKTQKHLKLYVKDFAENSRSLELIGFNQADWFTKLSRNQSIKIIYTLEINQWNNQEKVVGKIICLIN